MHLSYYNENCPKAAAWIQQLIDDKQIPYGYVDSRSILEVQPSDLRGFTQCHFFAGVAGWSLALKLAGWPTDRPVWTASCPCQPFSECGKKGGVEDERHLWPEARRLTKEVKPPTIFGEQVASKEGFKWLSSVFSDLEEEGYDTAGADLCGAWAGAPHLRQRIYFVADTGGQRGEGPFAGEDSGKIGPRWPRSPEDMFGIIAAPFERGDRHPQPLLRRMDDGFSSAVDLLRGYGNAIIPQVAATFIRTYMEVTQP